MQSLLYNTEPIAELVPEFRHSVDVEKEKWDEKEQAVLEPVDQDLAGQKESVGDRKDGGHHGPVHEEEVDPVEGSPENKINLVKAQVLLQVLLNQISLRLQ